MALPELWQRKPLEPEAKTQTSLSKFLRRLGMREQALLYLFGLGVAELLVSIWEPRAGMVIHGAILMTLLIHATIYARGLWQKFLIALALAPLIRLLSLTMPLPTFPFVYWYFVVGAPLFIAAFLVMRFGKLSAPMVGLSVRKPFWQVLVSLTGLGFGFLEYLILRPDPLVEEMHWRFIWLPALILLIFTGFLEELIFRGVMQYTALRSLGRFGMLYVTLVFVVLHIGYRSLLDLLFVFVVALFFAYVVHHTGSILGVSVSHGLINIGLFLVFPFLLATPVEQPPAPQDIIAPRPGLAATPIIVLPTRTYTPSPTPTPMTPMWLYLRLGSGTVLAPTETPLPTATFCSPKVSWELYTVRKGDSWRNVAQSYGVTAKSLKQANCLDNGAALSAGQRIYVPYQIAFSNSTPTSPQKQNDRSSSTPVEVGPTPILSTPTLIQPTSTTYNPTQTPFSPSLTPPMPTQMLPTASATSSAPPTVTMPAPTTLPPTPSSPPPTQIYPTATISTSNGVTPTPALPPPLQ